MNIIIHRYNSICEPDFIDAFKTVGIDVVEDNLELNDRNVPIEKKVEVLGEMILKNKPMFVFTINFFPYISMICDKLNVLYVCVSVDCPVAELFSNMITNKCNRVFLFDYEQYLSVKDFNPDCIFHMPLGVNTDRIDATLGVPEWEKIVGDSEFYKYDVSFVGSLYTEKNKCAEIYSHLPDRYRGMCDGLIAAQELINGQDILENALTEELIAVVKCADKEFYTSEKNIKNIDDFIVVNDYLSKELTVRDRLNLMYMMSTALTDIGKVHLFTRSDLSDLKAAEAPIVYHGGVRTLDEMPEVFRKSKINLNPTMRSIKSGLPQRVWDVLGCGGFLLTNYQQELPEYLEIGTHLEAYESIEEAVQKAAYYLSHEDERIEIARNGYEVVKCMHTMVNRVVEILKVVLGERG